MITIYFKNVGQGDSIIIEWEESNSIKVGIIDCHIYNGKNSVVDHLRQKNISEIEFIVLSHFHFDHFSGMADLFEYCLDKKIKVKNFYNTLNSLLGEIYNRIFVSQKIQYEIQKFVYAYEKFDKLVKDKVSISPLVNKLELIQGTFLSFLAPKGNLYEIMAKQLSRKVNKITTTNADINKLSTIIVIAKNEECILLTSDAVKKSFNALKLSKKVILAQIPHHGSWPNINTKFWSTLDRIAKCPSVASVGDEPKDKLPNKSTIEFFDTNNYDIYSTNSVYGISEYFALSSTKSSTSTSTALNSFSNLKKRYSTNTQNSKFEGKQIFNVL